MDEPRVDPDHARDHPGQPRLDDPRHGAPDGAVRDVALHQGEEGLLRRHLRHARAASWPATSRASGPGMLRPILKTYPLETMRPGDVYWFNDPYISDGAVQHHQDMVFAVPIFHEGASSPSPPPSGTTRTSAGCARAASRRTPPRSTTRAVLVPPVRIVREGQLNEEAYRIFLRNSRHARHGGGRHPGHDGLLPPRRDAGSRELFARYGDPHRARPPSTSHRARRGARARELFLELIPRARGASTTSSTATAGPRRGPTAST